MQLEYVCSAEVLTIVSSDWYLWLRACATFARIGLCEVVNEDVEDNDSGGGSCGETLVTGLAGLVAAMAAYESGEGATDLIEKSDTAFLTSAEAGTLLQGLREEEFFDKMCYDETRHQWVWVSIEV